MTTPSPRPADFIDINGSVMVQSGVSTTETSPRRLRHTSWGGITPPQLRSDLVLVRDTGNTGNYEHPLVAPQLEQTKQEPACCITLPH